MSQGTYIRGPYILGPYILGSFLNRNKKKMHFETSYNSAD